MAFFRGKMPNSVAFSSRRSDKTGSARLDVSDSARPEPAGGVGMGQALGGSFRGWLVDPKSVVSRRTFVLVDGGQLDALWERPSEFR